MKVLNMHRIKPRRWADLPVILLMSAYILMMPVSAVQDKVAGATAKVPVMILGTYHLDSPGRDLQNLKVDDVLTPKRQKELDELVRKLAAFQPTKIAVEVPYLEYMLKVGRDRNYVGADAVADWYRRNLRIFANLNRITEKGDRILLLFGAGHCYILRQLVMEAPGYKLVEPGDYL